jgi:hypothetical protein
LGDLFLCSRDSLMVLLGGFGFATSHVLVIRHFRVAWGRVPALAWVAVLPLVGVVAAALWLSFKAFAYRTIAFSMYAVLLLTAACAATGRVCRYRWTEPTYLLCVVGCALLVLSDAVLLVDQTLRVAGKRLHTLVVMLTYVAGEFCLHYGIAIDPMQKMGEIQPLSTVN